MLISVMFLGVLREKVGARKGGTLSRAGIGVTISGVV